MRYLGKRHLRPKLVKHREIDKQTKCWIWTGHWSRDRGMVGICKRIYGKVEIDVRVVAAYVWLGIPLRTKVIAQNLDVCKCKVCFNPEHLLAFDNKTDMMNYRHRKSAHTKNYARGEKLGTTTERQAIEIRDALIFGGEENIEIARRIGVSNQVVHYIKKRKTWKHIWIGFEQWFTMLDGKEET